MEDASLPDDTAAARPPAPATVICEEFLKVLGRSEVEQPMICQRICVCQQFWRYQHYFLPRWDWGIKKIVCFGLGSFRNVEKEGGPFPDRPHTYRDVIRKKQLAEEFNTRALDRHDALQAMLRHVAAIEMASSMKFCSSKRGVENHLIKSYFKKLTLIQELSWSGSSTKVPEKTVRELDKLPPTAGYGGDQDLIDIPVYFHDPEYSEEDKDALKRLSEIFRMAHLPPIQVVDAAEQDGELTVDEHTLVYAVCAASVPQNILRQTSIPGAMICGDLALDPGSKVDADRVGSILRGYEEFKLDRRRAPHTVGPSHMYIRKDIVEQTEKEGIVPPYPVNFPHDYPYPHRSWYLDKLKKKGGQGGQ
ncbi:7bec2957-d1f4-45da-9a5a-1e3107bef734 [Thermothielavioides terrestris]|uniref:7bec2957-d1f4-45da-9a5a-1e3107bef734 n=1 Tax=Thermothielavioides terrestris TaxID=2587410 RepID=A0A446BSH5_9PEZI|nr:7bec2957-d1f4-45da-9a5a-1e3107bef734 [Thermothielavioides terrestris]